MEETQAHDIDGKISPKGPWKCKNTVARNTYLAEKKKNSEEQ